MIRANKKTPPGTWKQIAAFVIALGAISHLTSTLVEMRADLTPKVNTCR